MLKHYFIQIISHYGNTGILIGLILEYIGLPVPGETMMSFLGYLVSKNSGMSVVKSIIYAAIGTFTGSYVAYLIAYKYGENIVLKFGKHLKITKDRLDNFKSSFAKRQALLLIFGRYIPGVRHLVPYVAGISRMKPSKFILYNFAGSIIWCVSFIGLGYVLGDKWSTVEKLIKTYILILVLMAIFVFIVLKYFGKHRKLILMTSFPLFIFIKLSEDLIRKELTFFDATIYKYVSEFISSRMTLAMKFFTSTGSWQALILISLVSYLFVLVRKKNLIIGHLIAVNLLSSTLLNELFKLIFRRDRPGILRLIDISGYSFPSGHSMIGLSFYGLLIYFLFKYVKSPWKYIVNIVLLLLILMIGISRIYLGVHYASDVFAGFSAGLAWLFVYIEMINKLYLSEKREM